GRVCGFVALVVLTLVFGGAGGSAASTVAGGGLVFASDAGIFVVNLDGTGLTRLTTGKFDGSPAGSPDGRRIVFDDSRLEANGTIEVMKGDGGGRENLGLGTSVPPAWSPDGSRIAFFDSARGGHELAVVNIRTKRELRIRANGVTGLSWAPD